MSGGKSQRNFLIFAAALFAAAATPAAQAATCDSDGVAIPFKEEPFKSLAIKASLKTFQIAGMVFKQSRGPNGTPEWSIDTSSSPPDDAGAYPILKSGALVGEIQIAGDQLDVRFVRANSSFNSSGSATVNLLDPPDLAVHATPSGSEITVFTRLLIPSSLAVSADPIAGPPTTPTTIVLREPSHSSSTEVTGDAGMSLETKISIGKIDELETVRAAAAPRITYSGCSATKMVKVEDSTWKQLPKAQRIKLPPPSSLGIVDPPISAVDPAFELPSVYGCHGVCLAPSARAKE